MSELQRVEIRVNTAKGKMADEYCGYEIHIITSDGTIIIEGCHDITPDVVHASTPALKDLVWEDPE